ncbi:MAG TPA: family 10 glycosylhydrolase [Pyrinomonadaceae bacterium]|nr:family 10 glycosylhydrolase [Pyrinomonadaceae bacterium]
MFFAILSLLVSPTFVEAQDNPEYRAYWAETFNTQMGTRDEIDRLVDSAVQSNANAIFAQVRRRGDSWYLDTKEPLTQVANVGEPDASGKWTIDPLKYLIERAHARGVEVHAFVIVGSIYNAHPTITGLPKDPNHVFNQHFWDKTTSAPYTDSRQWSTRSLPHNPDGTTFNGQRYTAEWYVDLGHPDAAAYTVDVLTHLVRQYDLDGLHLDRIRYPEAPIDRPAGQPLGINTGYNETSVNRFKARYGNQATYYQASDVGTNVGTTAAPRLITAADVGYPKTNDALWNNWRRDQVTNVVRRIYLNATAVKPEIKVSAALICFWTGPTASGGWEKTEAYYRVFQDWQAWTREGTLDIVAPMIYKQEHIASVRAQYDDWLAYSKKLAKDNNRHSLAGLGIYLNGIEGSLLQTRRALARPPYETGNTAADGVIFYALGSTIPNRLTGNSTNAAVTNNPFSYPIPGVSTPKRPNADFFAALRTGASANGATRFENILLAPLFPTVVPVPDMPWKSSPTNGYIKGIAERADQSKLDSASVTITNLNTGSTRSTVTDGGGFYGGVDLAPGEYLVKAQLGSETLYSCVANVTAGNVTTADLQSETTAPTTSASVDPADPTGTNGWYINDVTISLSASDNCSGVAATEYSIDGGASWTAYTGSLSITAEGVTTVQYRSTDRAGNVETTKTITVQIDKSAPTISLTANPSTIRSPNGKPVTVRLRGTGSDAVSGLASVSYTVTDEYGTSLSIPTRTLSGNSDSWTDSIDLEASRRGDDLDGRLYRITATITDVAGNTSTATVDIVVSHDQRKN